MSFSECFPVIAGDGNQGIFTQASRIQPRDQLADSAIGIMQGVAVARLVAVRRQRRDVAGRDVIRVVRRHGEVTQEERFSGSPRTIYPFFDEPQSEFFARAPGIQLEVRSDVVALLGVVIVSPITSLPI